MTSFISCSKSLFQYYKFSSLCPKHNIFSFDPGILNMPHFWLFCNIFFNFLCWNNFRFTKELQRWVGEFSALNVNFWHHHGTLLKPKLLTLVHVKETINFILMSPVFLLTHFSVPGSCVAFSHCVSLEFYNLWNFQSFFVFNYRTDCHPTPSCYFCSFVAKVPTSIWWNVRSPLSSMAEG